MSTWPLPKPGTKMRAWRVAGRVAVLCDQLREAGLYPFPRPAPRVVKVVTSPWVPDGTAYVMSELNGWFKEQYAEVLSMVRMEIRGIYP